jgi:hypothetical protein
VRRCFEGRVAHYYRIAAVVLAIVLDKTDRYGVLTHRDGVAANGCGHSFVRYSRRFGVFMIRTSTLRTNRIENVVRQLPKYKIDLCGRIGVGRRHRVAPD